MTGSVAHALADHLHATGCRAVFAYPGTSELALADAIDSHPGLDLVNARGDKEAVFLAAGANAFRPGEGVALVHGARGLTNALGAVADVRRSEISTLVLIGLPSTRSAPYVPPHGEIGLVAGAGVFARAAFEVAGARPDEGLEITLCRAGAALRESPFGPVLVGIPQDVLEVPFAGMLRLSAPVAEFDDAQMLDHAARWLQAASRPVILVDDFALREDNSPADIARLSGALHAPVLQLAYRRGPMLFQQLRRDEVPRFLGMYDPSDGTHRAVLENADALVTVEDRNMYPRVVGRLPACRKLALTSDPVATGKNGYLGPDDVLVAGHIPHLLRRLAGILGDRADGPVSIPDPAPGGRDRAGSAEGEALAAALGDSLRTLPRVLVVDDSQMFGGLLARHYEKLRPDRVFGSHGGFVGSGLAKAAGMARVAGTTVVCCVGDQAFLNGVQALASAAEHRLPVLIVVCNNGCSVSLKKQSRAEGLTRMPGRSRFLDNPASIDYLAIAAGYGIEGQRVDWLNHTTLDATSEALQAAIGRGLSERRPFVVEIRTPSSGAFWSGVWATQGMDAAVVGVSRRIPVAS